MPEPNIRIIMLDERALRQAFHRYVKESDRLIDPRHEYTDFLMQLCQETDIIDTGVPVSAGAEVEFSYRAIRIKPDRRKPAAPPAAKEEEPGVPPVRIPNLPPVGEP